MNTTLELVLIDRLDKTEHWRVDYYNDSGVRIVAEGDSWATGRETLRELTTKFNPNTAYETIPSLMKSVDVMRKIYSRSIVQTSNEKD